MARPARTDTDNIHDHSKQHTNIHDRLVFYIFFLFVFVCALLVQLLGYKFLIQCIYLNMLNVAYEAFVGCLEKEKRKQEDQFVESQRGALHKFFFSSFNKYPKMAQ